MITKFQGHEYIMHRYSKEPLIRKEDFPVPAKQIFNCAQTMYHGKTVLLIAAVYDMPNDEWEKNWPDGTGIHVAMSEDGIHFDIDSEPLFKREFYKDFPEMKFDSWVIDPRMTKIDDTYYIIRPVQLNCPQAGPAAVLYKTKDFKNVEFVECIALPSNRVPCLFPEKINGEYIKIDRPYNYPEMAEPSHDLDDTTVAGMWISYSPNMIYWGKYRPLLYPPMSYANFKIGPTPPIKTKDGWLVIIHGVWKENREFCYSLGAILLDLENPEKVIGVLDKPILVPQEDYELYGVSDNTIFACGAIADEEKDQIKIYYGAADTCIGLAIGSISEMLEELKNNDSGLHM